MGPRMDRPHTRIASLLACMAVSAGLASSILAADPEHHKTHPAQANAHAAVPTAINLADLEQMALQGNPTLAQAAAAVDASRGKALQAGLCPNPTIGYRGENIGIEGTAGEFQGGFVQQTIVTAGKRRLSRGEKNPESCESELMVPG